MPAVFLEQFSPGEASSITGCSNAVQAQYRARGFIASNAGKNARFEMFSLALMLFVRTLNDRDLGFVAARTFGPLVVDSIVRRVLRHAEAFDLAGLSADDDMPLDELAASVLEVFPPSGPEKTGYDAGRFLILWADSTGGFYNEISPALFEAEAAQHPRRVCGPVTIFDTQAAADELLRRAARPLVRVGAQAVPFAAFSNLALAV